MTRSRRRVGSAVIALALAGVANGCSSADGWSNRRLTVLAASSLTEVFAELAERYEAEHPHVDVQLSFGGSSTLARQVLDGAPADVLATADEATMADVSSAGLIAPDPVLFATNSLVLVVPADNPARIEDVRDLASPAIDLALCDPAVPCGAAAEQLLALRRLSVTPATLEPDVKSVLTKVVLGEVDAGLVYRTDARAAAEEVRALVIAGAGRILNAYPIGVLTTAEDAASAQAWLDLVVSREGRQVLKAAGFGLP